MSASSKKKLRKEQVAAQMTERQIHEQKEAKKLKIYTAVFTAVLALLVVLAVVFGVSKFISNNGIFERNTVALTIGEHKLTNADLNYYYIAQINEFYEQNGDYMSIFGLDPTKPLNEQVTNEETGATWADDFLDAAINTAKQNYALVDAANAAGYTLSEDELASIDQSISTMELYATLGNYPSVKSYLKAMYGKGATEANYREYVQTQTLATSYYAHYAGTLDFDDAAIEAEDKANPLEYNHYSYNSYYMFASKFYEGGTEDENGTVVYSDEEKAAGVAKAEETAKALAEAEYENLEAFDKAIGELSINAESETAVASTAYNDTAYANVNEYIREWVTDPARKAGDMGYFANESTTTDADGKETTTVNGYYVVMYHSTEDNKYPLANVRHILIQPEGGTYNSTTGRMDYSEEEMTKTKPEAELLLDKFLAGETTAEAFGALANEHSADGDGTTGGLYEDVAPGQMVENFENWCFEEGRKAGDTGIVDSVYGWHIMYYVGDSETSYREYLVETVLIGEAFQAWFDDLVENTTVTEGNTSYVDMDIVLANG